MLKKLKYFVIDIETTGLLEGERSDEYQMLQFSAIYEDPELQLPFETIPKFNRFIRHPYYIGQSYALWLNSDILLKLSTDRGKIDPDPEIVNSYAQLMKDFKDWVLSLNQNAENKTYINCAGKNFGTFDLQFIKKAVKQYEITYLEKYPIRFRHKILDPAILYVNDEDETLPGLEKCLERAGVKREIQKDGSIVTHDALLDNWDVIQLFRNKYRQ